MKSHTIVNREDLVEFARNSIYHLLRMIDQKYTAKYIEIQNTEKNKSRRGEETTDGRTKGIIWNLDATIK